MGVIMVPMSWCDWDIGIGDQSDFIIIHNSGWFILLIPFPLPATLYFAMGLQSAILTPIAAVLQVIALLWFVISYIPGGQTGLKWFTKLFTGFCKSAANRNLPV